MWIDNRNWKESNTAFHQSMIRHYRHLGNARALATEISLLSQDLFGLMDELCSVSCRFCPSPCCIAATVWIDFRDLLYLHLGFHPIPLSQVVSGGNDPCRYLGPRGCLLPRRTRPWACTVYMCGVQVKRFRRMPKGKQRRFEAVIRTIKAKRFDMEDEYVRVIRR